MDADTSEKIRDVISFVHGRTLSIGVYSPGDISVKNMYEEAVSDLAEIIQQEIAKEDRRGLEVLGAVLNAAGGEVIITKADMIDLDKYVIMNYRNLDGSVTYAVTLKEHKEE